MQNIKGDNVTTITIVKKNYSVGVVNRGAVGLNANFLYHSCKVLWIFFYYSGLYPWKLMKCVIRLCPCASSDYSEIVLFDKSQTNQTKGVNLNTAQKI